MALKPAQLSLHWREFAAAKRACKQAGHAEPDRHTLYVQALGKDKSLTKFNNGDLDKVLAVFRAISQSDNFDGQVKLAQMHRTRLLHGLRNHPHFNEAYVKSICGGEDGRSGRFGTHDFDSLSTAQLEQLRNTLADREVSYHEPETVTRRALQSHKRAAEQTRIPALEPEDDNVPF